VVFKKQKLKPRKGGWGTRGANCFHSKVQRGGPEPLFFLFFSQKTTPGGEAGGGILGKYHPQRFFTASPGLGAQKNVCSVFKGAFFGIVFGGTPDSGPFLMWGKWGTPMFFPQTPPPKQREKFFPPPTRFYGGPGGKKPGAVLGKTQVNFFNPQQFFLGGKFLDPGLPSAYPQQKGRGGGTFPKAVQKGGGGPNHP